MIAPIKPVFGALRLLSERAVSLRQFGLTLWTNAGMDSIIQFSKQARDASHRAEVLTSEIEKQITRIISDGRVDLEEIKELRDVLPQLKRVEDATHDIGEAVQI